MAFQLNVGRYKIDGKEGRHGEVQRIQPASDNAHAAQFR
jgi:hypothetical protein